VAVYYFVVAQDGSRYGPADVDTLVLWAREGRLVAETTLIERGTDRQVRACDLPALSTILGAPAPSQPGVRIERDPYPTATHPGYRQPHAAGATPPMQFPAAMQYAHGRRLSHRSKIVAGILGLIFGWLGVHRFYLGYTGIGLIQLLLSCTGISAIWGFVEGIIILTGGMQDAEGRELRD